MGDARFLPDLFARLAASGAADEGWEDQVAFLQELCGLAKHLQPGNRAALLGKLAHLGLFEVPLAPLLPYKAAPKSFTWPLLKGSLA